jgi:hypothetical protein
MIVAMQELATDEQIQDVVEHLIRMGFSVHRTTGERPDHARSNRGSSCSRWLN